MKSFFRASIVLQVFLLAGFMLFTSCKNGNLAGRLNDNGSGGTVATLSDASEALRVGNYSRAIELYNAVLASDPNNSEALYGSSAALVGSTGLNFGQLVSNLLSETGLSGSSVNSLGDWVQSARNGPSSSINCASANSILQGVNCDALNDIIDRAVCQLQKIASGAASGKIKKDDISVLLDFASLCLVRAVLRPLRAAFLDIRNVNGDYSITYTANMTDACNNNPTVMKNFISDVAGTYALFNRVVNLLNLGQNQVIRKLRDDIDTVGTQVLTASHPNALPAACLNLFETQLGINVNNFKTRLEAFDPPAASCQ